ncbi:hypothetical protein C3L33_10629, partial [Rhododendron williamsianum]
MRIVALSKDMIAWFHQDLSLHRGDSQADLCMLDQVISLFLRSNHKKPEQSNGCSGEFVPEEPYGYLTSPCCNF